MLQWWIILVISSILAYTQIIKYMYAAKMYSIHGGHVKRPKFGLVGSISIIIIMVSSVVVILTLNGGNNVWWTL